MIYVLDNLKALQKLATTHVITFGVNTIKLSSVKDLLNLHKSAALLRDATNAARLERLLETRFTVTAETLLPFPGDRVILHGFGSFSTPCPPSDHDWKIATVTAVTPGWEQSDVIFDTLNSDGSFKRNEP